MSDLRNKPRMAVSRGSAFHPPMVRNRAPSSGLPNDVLTKYEPRIKSCFEEERKQIDEETTLRTSGIRMGKKEQKGKGNEEDKYKRLQRVTSKKQTMEMISSFPSRTGSTFHPLIIRLTIIFNDSAIS